MTALAARHNDLSSDPSTHIKSHEWLWLCVSEAGGLLESGSCWPTSQFIKRPFSPRSKQKVTVLGVGGLSVRNGSTTFRANSYWQPSVYNLKLMENLFHLMI